MPKPSRSSEGLTAMSLMQLLAKDTGSAMISPSRMLFSETTKVYSLSGEETSKAPAWRKMPAMVESWPLELM